jgi:hypothetical protein
LCHKVYEDIKSGPTSWCCAVKWCIHRESGSSVHHWLKLNQSLTSLESYLKRLYLTVIIFIRKESESTRANATSVNSATNSIENNSLETLKNTVPETKNSEDIKHTTVESNKEHGDTRADITNKLNQLAISPSDSVKDNNVNEKEHYEGVINDTDLRLSSQKEKNEEISDIKADRSSLQKTQEMRTKTVLQRETQETSTKEVFLRSIKETLMQWFTNSTYRYFKMTLIRNHDDLEDDSSCKG